MNSQESPFDFDAFRRRIADMYLLGDLAYVLERDGALVEVKVTHPVIEEMLETAVRRGLLTPAEAHRYRQGTAAEALEVITAARARWVETAFGGDGI
jgi:hypothetical protein